MEHPKRTRAILLVVLLPALLLCLALLDVRSPRSLCFSKSVLGVSCPGCGLTRSMSAALHGDLTASVRFHALGVPILVALACLWAALLWRRRELALLSLFTPAVTLAVLLVGYWIFRTFNGTLPT